MIIELFDSTTGALAHGPLTDFDAAGAGTVHSRMVLGNALAVGVRDYAPGHLCTATPQGDEWLYVLEGALSLTIDSTTHEVVPGYIAFLPTSVPYTLASDRRKGCKAVVIQQRTAAEHDVRMSQPASHPIV